MTSLCLSLSLTSWTFLLALLDLLPLGELGAGLRSLLKFGNEELDVVQDVIQDLLPNEKFGFQRAFAHCYKAFLNPIILTASSLDSPHRGPRRLQSSPPVHPPPQTVSASHPLPDDNQ